MSVSRRHVRTAAASLAVGALVVLPVTAYAATATPTVSPTVTTSATPTPTPTATTTPAPPVVPVAITAMADHTVGSTIAPNGDTPPVLGRGGPLRLHRGAARGRGRPGR